jgi:hypothetical protein
MVAYKGRTWELYYQSLHQRPFDKKHLILHNGNWYE